MAARNWGGPDTPSARPKKKIACDKSFFESAIQYSKCLRSSSLNFWRSKLQQDSGFASEVNTNHNLADMTGTVLPKFGHSVASLGKFPSSK
jgi:hypothetical protein